MVATVCAVSASGCASWQGPRIDPSGERILLWPGQTPAAVAPAPAVPVFAAPVAAPGSTPPLPPSVGLPSGNLLAPPVYPNAGLPATPLPAITVPGTVPPAPALPTTSLPAAAVPTVDAQWAFPAPTIAQVGHPLVLTTLVTRRSDRAPLAGWIVRYEVSSPTASFGQTGGSVVEVTTDTLGRASIEIRPTNPGEGAAVVNMAVVPPAQLSTGAGTTTEVGRGSATITWKNGVPGAPLWPADPVIMSPAMSAPTLSGPTFSDQALASSNPSSTDSTYSNERPASRFDPPPSLSTDSSTPKTYAPPPKPETVGKPELAVQVRRSGPDRVTVGGFARFEVTVTNRGDATARGIKVLSRFDSGLSHARAIDDELAVKYEAMSNLAPGESATVPLTFGVRSAGQLCHEVTVTAEGAAAVVERGCVNAVAAKPVTTPALEVTKQGPTRHYVGEQAKFRIVIKNTGDVAVTNLEVVDQYDQAFEPRFTDAGREILPDGSFQWRIPRLEVGEKRTINVQCDCVTPARSACSRVTVTADDDLKYAEDKCVEILPLATAPPSGTGGGAPPPALPTTGLKLSLRSSANPARVGQPMMLLAFIENTGQQTERSVSLRVQLPMETLPDVASIRPAGAFEIVGQREVRYNNLGNLRPGERKNIEIPLRVDRPGIITFWGEVASAGLATPITIESNPIQIEAASQ